MIFSKKNVLLVVSFTLLCVACGKPESEELHVQLVSAHNDVSREALFLGVSEQSILWVSLIHGNREYYWDGVSSLPFSPEPGDRLVFTGSAGGTVLVYGEATVGSENPLSIPLMRR